MLSQSPLLVSWLDIIIFLESSYIEAIKARAEIPRNPSLPKKSKNKNPKTIEVSHFANNKTRPLLRAS